MPLPNTKEGWKNWTPNIRRDLELPAPEPGGVRWAVTQALKNAREMPWSWNDPRARGFATSPTAKAFALAVNFLQPKSLEEAMAFSTGFQKLLPSAASASRQVPEVLSKSEREALKEAARAKLYQKTGKSLAPAIPKVSRPAEQVDLYEELLKELFKQNQARVWFR